MSIEDRLRDVRVLYDQERFEGAMLSAMIAAAATSRLRYPYPANKDSFAFPAFLHSEFSGCCKVSYEGAWHPLATFLYRWVRNSLAHEGGAACENHLPNSREPAGCGN